MCLERRRKTAEKAKKAAEPKEESAQLGEVRRIGSPRRSNRGQHEVARDGGTHGDLRGLPIPDFTNHYDIGIEQYLTREQITEAQRLSREWIETHPQDSRGADP